MGYKGRIHYQVMSWLKAGILNENVFEKTESGTPQGGVISPLLANIALHGMEEHLKGLVEKEEMRHPAGKAKSKRDKRNSLAVIRYADDLVVMHESKEVVLKCQEALQNWLRRMGLELKKEKTRIAHTLYGNESEDGKAGFDFLGLTIKQFLSKYHSATRNKEGTPYIRTLVYPSEKAINRHQERMKEIIRTSKAKNQDGLIGELNPVITG
jgi:RNA-directed DNA polymerase